MIKYTSTINTFNNLRIEENHPNVIKIIYEKPTSEIISTGEKTENFFSQIRNKTRMPVLVTSLNIVLFRAIRQGKDIKGITMEKK